MTKEEVYQNVEPDKIDRDKIDSNYLSNDDYEICNYVINNLFKVNYPSYKGKIISKRNAIKNSLKYFEKFDKENYYNLCTLLHHVKFIKDFDIYNAAVETAFDVISKDTHKEIISPGFISTYHLPKKIYNINIISLGHEHCHALKETNYLEHKNCLVLGEVIPIFYELIDYDKDFLREKYLQYRLYWLNEQKEIYMLFPEKTEIENKSMYAFAKTFYGTYLNSFYYALILYSMYKEDPIKILKLVSSILKHEITTLDMLNKLNIYCDIKGDIFEKEIKTIKKVLSL